MGMKFNFKNKNNRESLKNINFFILKKLFFFISIVYLIYCLKININNISLGIDLASFKFNIILSFVFCILSIFFNAYAWANITSWLGYKGRINNLVSLIIKNEVRVPNVFKKCKMINIIGKDYLKFKDIEKEFIAYDYFKEKVRPNRKMGHYIDFE